MKNALMSLVVLVLVVTFASTSFAIVLAGRCPTGPGGKPSNINAHNIPNGVDGGPGQQWKCEPLYCFVPTGGNGKTYYTYSGPTVDRAGHHICTPKQGLRA